MDAKLRAFTVLAHMDCLEKISGDGTLKSEDVEPLIEQVEKLRDTVDKLFRKSSVSNGIEMLEAKKSLQAAMEWIIEGYNLLVTEESL